MNAKIKLVLAVVLALCFLGLSIGALEVVPKYIEDRYYVMGVEGKWSNLVSLLFYVMAAMCGFYGWLYGHENEMYKEPMNLKRGKDVYMRELRECGGRTEDKTKCAKG